MSTNSGIIGPVLILDHVTDDNPPVRGELRLTQTAPVAAMFTGSTREEVVEIATRYLRLRGEGEAAGMLLVGFSR